ncbi:hypothetical protein [Flindersiella endophytica]
MAKRSTAQVAKRQGALGTGRDWRQRILFHHLPLAAASVLLFFLFMWIAPSNPTPMNMTSDGVLPQAAAAMSHGGTQSPDIAIGGGGGIRALMASSTTATGYVATVLLALTLLIGPANLLLRRPNPVSSSLARDVGIWAFIGSVIHVVIGFQVHGNVGELFNFRLYFFDSSGIPKTNAFGWANWTGLAALIIVAGLLALSNDRSLRELKARRWKNLQRTNYALFALIVLHAFFYGALLRTTSPLTWTLGLSFVTVLAGQAIGIWLYRHKRALTGGDGHVQPPSQPQPTGARP